MYSFAIQYISHRQTHTHIYNGYQVIVPSWCTIPFTLIKKYFGVPIYCMCAVTFAFFFVYAHFLNFTGGLQDVMFNVGVCICVCVHERRMKEGEKARKRNFLYQLCYITKYAASRMNCLAGCRHTAGTVMTHRTSLPSSTEEDWSFTSWNTHTHTHTQILLLSLLLSKLHSTDNIFIRLIVIEILISVLL